MKIFYHERYYLLFLAISIALLTSCSDRLEYPELMNDSTFVYSSKSDNAINAKITFYDRIKRKTNSLIGAGTDFEMKENKRVRAIIFLSNRERFADKTLMFHLDWINPEKESIYRKRIDLIPTEPDSVLKSSISISPEMREPGDYYLKVYLFRELIAEKKFTLLPENPYETEEYLNLITDSIKTEILFSRKEYKKSYKSIAGDSSFIIAKNAKLRAKVDIKNRNDFLKTELKFKVAWIDPGDNVLYTKKILLNKSDSSSSLTSAISITPGKRKPGKYKIKIFLFEKLINIKHFDLIIPRKKKNKTQIKTPENEKFSINAEIYLSNSYRKQPDKGESNFKEFRIKKNAKVYARIMLKNETPRKDKNLEFYVAWIGPGKEPIFRKKAIVKPNLKEIEIRSNISITPQKRTSGNYQLILTLFNDIIAKEEFRLIER